MPIDTVHASVAGMHHQLGQPGSKVFSYATYEAL